MKTRKWLLAADKETLVNLDRVVLIRLVDGAVWAILSDGDDALLYPAETGELGFDHLRRELIGEES